MLILLNNTSTNIRSIYLKIDFLSKSCRAVTTFKSDNARQLSNYLINKDNYKIFHSLDDYLTNKSQLKELKGFCDDKLVLFNNGAHLGFLYRDEFINKLKEEIKLTNISFNR